jgi:hypothetical protein
MASLKDLAAEREQRNRERGISATSDPTPATKKANSSAWATPARQAPASSLNSLKMSHRSIRMGHSIGLIICAFSIFIILFPWVMRTQILILGMFMLGVWIARSGGALIHSWLPSHLKEGEVPTPAEIDSHDKNLFLPTMTGERCILEFF